MIPNKQGRKYTMKVEKDRDVYLQAIAMIDLATGWIEIHSVPKDGTDLVAYQVELGWLTRYPLPNKITLDGGEYFSVEIKTMMANDYTITLSPSVEETNKQTQLWRGHIKLFVISCIDLQSQKMELDNENIWEVNISSTILVGVGSLISTRKPTGN